MKTLRSVDKFGCKFSISAISMLCKNLAEYIRKAFLPSNLVVKVCMAVNDREEHSFLFGNNTFHNRK